MVLTNDERTYLEDALDKCDATLDDKPSLASVYDASWRTAFRKKTLSVEGMHAVRYPLAYVLPHFERYYPAELQRRIEEAATFFLPKLGNADRNHMIERLRSDSSSAEEELLLARGFSLEFGQDAVVAPRGGRKQSRAEFTVLPYGKEGQEIDIEAKGLFDSQRIQALNRAALESGTNCWVTGEDSTHDLNRLRSSVVDKMEQGRAGVPKIVVLTQYTAWPTAPEAAELLRALALEPEAHNVPCVTQVLGIAYIFERFVQGVWHNPSVAKTYKIPLALLPRLRTAISRLFYPRPDGLLLTEEDDDDAHMRMVRRVSGVR